MPIKSYLAHPVEGKKEELSNSINSLKGCEIISAENENLLVVVTETETEIEDKNLKETIEELES
jgi:nitrate reductase NapAB chaperone NapD